LIIMIDQRSKNHSMRDLQRILMPMSVEYRGFEFFAIFFYPYDFEYIWSSYSSWIFIFGYRKCSKMDNLKFLYFFFMLSVRRRYMSNKIYLPRNRSTFIIMKYDNHHQFFASLIISGKIDYWFKWDILYIIYHVLYYIFFNINFIFVKNF